jgi:hypothetical protein
MSISKLTRSDSLDNIKSRVNELIDAVEALEQQLRTLTQDAHHHGTVGGLPPRY